MIFNDKKWIWNLFCCALCSASLFIMAFGTICSYYFGLCDVCLFVVVIVVAGKNERSWMSVCCWNVWFDSLQRRLPLHRGYSTFPRSLQFILCAGVQWGHAEDAFGSLLNDFVEWVCNLSLKERVFGSQSPTFHQLPPLEIFAHLKTSTLFYFSSQNSSQNKALNINFVIFVFLQILSRNRPISYRVQRAERSAADTACPT